MYSPFRLQWKQLLYHHPPLKRSAQLLLDLSLSLSLVEKYMDLCRRRASPAEPFPLLNVIWYREASSLTLNFWYVVVNVLWGWSQASSSTRKATVRLTVNRWRFSFPSQKLVLLPSLPKPFLYSVQFREKSSLLLILLWKTVQPPPSVFMSQNTLIAPFPSGSMRYKPVRDLVTSEQSVGISQCFSIKYYFIC